MDASYFIFMAVVTVVVLLFVSRSMGTVGRVRCTRCDGTGQVNEKWPDPSAPGGWHIVDGKCPKCKGKGRV